MMIFVMKIGVMGTSRKYIFDGTPCAVKVACTVWVRGKNRDNIKILPIDISYFTDTSTVEGRLW